MQPLLPLHHVPKLIGLGRRNLAGRFRAVRFAIPFRSSEELPDAHLVEPLRRKPYCRGGSIEFSEPELSVGEVVDPRFFLEAFFLGASSGAPINPALRIACA